MNPAPLAPNVRGITYPLTVVNGNLSTSTDYDLISQQVRSVIDTRFFERVMRADYGIDDYTLSIIDPGQINSDFKYAITNGVSGITGVGVEGDWITEGDDGIYKVYITYSVDGVPQPPLEYALSN